MKTPLKLSVLMLSISAITNSMAADQLETITVSENTKNSPKSSVSQVKDDIVHTEIISQKMIERKQAGNVAEAIKNEPGVRVSTECSMCGVKRIQLNGLKGEHTTLMFNGVPNSSIVEGFYGFDAIPTAGVSNIEIARGAGASLIAPEAIGGVINVVNQKPQNDSLTLDLANGSEGYKKYQLVGSKISEDGNTQLLVAGQTDNIDQYDQDGNHVNEAPQLTNQSLSAQIWHRLTPNDQLDFRITDQQSEVFGGPMLDGYLAVSKSDARTQPEGSAPNFIGGNVNNKPDKATTTARDFLENITSNKQSYTGKWTHDLNDRTSTRVAASYVDSTMDAIYEGTSYKADQDIYYVDARADYFLNAEHAFTFGIDYKFDKMRSQSTGGSEPANDSYDHHDNGFYIRDIWTPNTRTEIALALRADNVRVDFVDQDRKFDETVFAPRAHLRYDHNFQWTSRLSGGMGYRVPLQFFEADHGILDDGFGVAVDQLEKSNSLRYALSYSGAKTTINTSYSWTEVSNLAALDTENYARPTLISTDGTGNVQHADISLSYQINRHWRIGGNVEAFVYDQHYRSTFSVIPIEERIRLMADYIGHGWEGNLTFTGIGERNYKDYTTADYQHHYDDATSNQSKGNKAPAYFTADAKISKDITKHWNLYAGVNNLFDFTQTSDGDSPLFYDDTGAWDVGHIWGPLRGRVVYGGIKATF